MNMLLIWRCHMAVKIQLLKKAVGGKLMILTRSQNVLIQGTVFLNPNTLMLNIRMEAGYVRWAIQELFVVVVIIMASSGTSSTSCPLMMVNVQIVKVPTKDYTFCLLLCQPSFCSICSPLNSRSIRVLQKGLDIFWADLQMPFQGRKSDLNQLMIGSLVISCIVNSRE